MSIKILFFIVKSIFDCTYIVSMQYDIKNILKGYNNGMKMIQRAYIIIIAILLQCSQGSDDAISWEYVKKILA